MNFSQKTKLKGFTLIELMVALAIIVVLMAYAIPAYNNFSQRQALSNETNNIIGDLNFARNLAIDKSSLVTVSSTSGSDWEGGWTITLTLPGGGTEDVRVKQAIAGNIKITETGGFGTVIYDNLGAISPTSQAMNLNIQNAPDYPNYILLRVLPSGIISSSRTL